MSLLSKYGTAATQAQNMPKPKQEPILEGLKLADVLPKKKKVAFPVDALPERLGRILTRAVNSAGMDMGYLGPWALGVAGGCIGNRVKLRVKNTWLDCAALWVAGVGPSATAKTPTYVFATSPLRAFEKEIEAAYQLEVVEYKDRWRHLKRGEEPEEPFPVREQLTIDIATVEAVYRDLQRSPKGIVLTMDEGIGWIASLGQYSKNSDAATSFWLSVYQNIMRKKGVVKEDVSNILDNPFCSVVIGIQPVKMQTLGGNNRDQDGFLFRVLFGICENEKTRHFSFEDDLDLNDIKKYEEIMRQLYECQIHLTQALNNEIVLSEEAKKVAADWINNVNNKMIDAAPQHRSLFSKFESHLFRISLVLELLDWACYGIDCFPPSDAGKVFPKMIRAETVERAIKIVDYFRDTALEVHRMMKYEAIPDHILKAAELYASGKLQKEIANEMRKAESTISKWKSAYPELFIRLNDYPNVESPSTSMT